MGACWSKASRYMAFMFRSVSPFGILMVKLDPDTLQIKPGKSVYSRIWRETQIFTSFARCVIEACAPGMRYYTQSRRKHLRFLCLNIHPCTSAHNQMHTRHSCAHTRKHTRTHTRTHTSHKHAHTCTHTRAHTHITHTHITHMHTHAHTHTHTHHTRRLS